MYFPENRNDRFTSTPAVPGRLFGGPESPKAVDAMGGNWVLTQNMPHPGECWSRGHPGSWLGFLARRWETSRVFSNGKPYESAKFRRIRSEIHLRWDLSACGWPPGRTTRHCSNSINRGATFCSTKSEIYAICCPWRNLTLTRWQASGTRARGCLKRWPTTCRASRGEEAIFLTTSPAIH